jgi:hypothetical protein
VQIILSAVLAALLQSKLAADPVTGAPTIAGRASANGKNQLSARSRVTSFQFNANSSIGQTSLPATLRSAATALMSEE